MSGISWRFREAGTSLYPATGSEKQLAQLPTEKMGPRSQCVTSGLSPRSLCISVIELGCPVCLCLGPAWAPLQRRCWWGRKWRVSWEGKTQECRAWSPHDRVAWPCVVSKDSFLPIFFWWGVSQRISVARGQTPQWGGQTVSYKWAAWMSKAADTPLGNDPCWRVKIQKGDHTCDLLKRSDPLCPQTKMMVPSATYNKQTIVSAHKGMVAR